MVRWMRGFMSKLKGRRQLQQIKGGSGVYQWLKQNNKELLDKCLPKIYSPPSLEQCKEIALKYKTRTEFQKGNGAAYVAARINSWLEECCAHMPKPTVYTLESCKEEARKYKTRTEFQKGNGAAYVAAYRNSWLGECCVHMPKPVVHTLESCKEEARKYKTRAEFKRGNEGTYAAARVNSWLEECCAHMPYNVSFKKVINLDTKEIFSSARRASLKLGLSKGAVNSAIRRNKKCKGYRWAYCDDQGNVLDNKE